MISPDPDPQEQELANRLAELLEGLRSGDDPGELSAAVTPELGAMFRDAQEVLRFLEADRRADGGLASGAPADTPSPEPLTWVEEFSQPVQFGRFRILRELGRGGQSMVFLAHDPHLGREVALKVPRPEVLDSAESRRRFVREARAAGGLDHPNVVPIHEADQQGPFCYIVSAYIAGPTLREWLDGQAQPVAARDAARLVATLADAVAYMHGRGILHRDLKPSNILMASGGRKPPVEGGESIVETEGLRPPLAEFIPRITDFGLAKLVEADEESTRSGVCIGTPLYMAPEQANGRLADIGPTTDVYALGVLLYELLTGSRPFEGSTAADTLRRIVSEEPLRPRQLCPELPRDLEAICLKCLEKSPDRRFRSAGALAADLRRFLHGEPTEARPLTLGQRAVKWARRRPALTALLGVSALAVLGSIVGTGWYGLEQGRHNQALHEVNTKLQKSNAALEKSNQELQARERQLQRRSYASQFKLAKVAWEKEQLGQAVELLDGLQPGPGQGDLRGFEWHYLKERCYPLRAVGRGHKAPLWCMAISPDGRTVATVANGGYDLPIRLWDPAAGRVRAVLSGKTTENGALAFSPNGLTLASASQLEDRHGPGEGILWDLATGRERARWSIPQGEVSGLAYGPDGKTLVLTTHRSVSIWDTATLNLRGFVPEPRFELMSLAMAPDGKSFAVGDSGGTVRLWDVSAARSPLFLKGHEQRVMAVAFSPDGRILASGSDDASVRLWDAATGKPWATLGGLRYPKVAGLAFSPDGRTLASAVYMHPQSPALGAVQLWNLADYKPGPTFDQHLGCLGGLGFLPGGRFLVLRCHDTLKVLDTDPKPEREPLPGHAPKETWALAFAPDGRTLASGGDDHLVRLWDLATSGERARLEGHDSLVTAVAYAPDGRTLASASYDGSVKLWEAGTGSLRKTLGPSGEKLRCLAISPDGKVLAAGTRNKGPNRVRLWQTDTGRELRPLDDHVASLRCMAFSPNGKLLATATEHGVVHLWDTSSWQACSHLDDTNQVGSLAFSPDGATLATGNRAGAVKLWELASGKPRATLLGHSNEVYSLAFSPDGLTLATAGEDRTVRLWQAATGEALLTLDGHGTQVNAIAFAPDGRTLASASHDGEIKLWRAVPRD